MKTEKQKYVTETLSGQGGVIGIFIPFCQDDLFKWFENRSYLNQATEWDSV